MAAPEETIVKEHEWQESEAGDSGMTDEEHQEMDKAYRQAEAERRNADALCPNCGEETLLWCGEGSWYCRMCDFGMRSC